MATGPGKKALQTPIATGLGNHRMAYGGQPCSGRLGRPMGAPMILPFTARRLTSVLLCVIAILVAGYIGTRYLALVHGHDYLLGFLRQFDMDSENNIPTWYSSTALFFVAWLLMFTAHAKQQNRDIYTRHWWGLAAIFLYLSLDEASSLHEMTIEPVRDALHTSGYFHYAWVLPAACLLVVFGLAYLRFLQNLPARIRSLFLLAG